MMLYLASPHSHRDYYVRLARERAAAEAAQTLLRKGIVVYAPVAYGGGILNLTGINTAVQSDPVPYETYINHGIHMLEMAIGFAVLELPGWQLSIGIKAELRAAERLDLEVQYVRPEDLAPNAWEIFHHTLQKGMNP